MTDIKLIDNRIIFDGHANTAQECNTITNVVNVLSESSDFSKVKVESGYAEFECTKELLYGHMIFPPYGIHDHVVIYFYDNETNTYISGYALNTSTDGINATMTLTQSSVSITNGVETDSVDMSSFSGFAGLSLTRNATVPDDGLAVGDSSYVFYSGGNYIVYPVTSSPEQQFNSDMNGLCNSINDKAGLTGQKTIAQMKTAASGIQKIIEVATVENLPATETEGTIAIITEVE